MNNMLFSGVESVSAEESDAPIEYYDLTGKLIPTPTQGLYIQRQGPKTKKMAR